jgi:hydroxymethylpyrimidine/phosphomethylpyrimidine kinase
MADAGRLPVALTIAGSDPSGGAGIQADLKTFTALGVYGASVITALTAQNTMGVTGVLAIPAEFIGQQIDAVATDLKIGAIKTGMLADRQTVVAVVDGIKRHGLSPLVVDPVMVATSGDVLLAPDAIDAVRTLLIPLAAIITPNLHEAARLLDEPVATTMSDMEAQGRRLLERGAKAVLVKGGHRTGSTAVDVLVGPGFIARHEAPHIETPNTHGTGCTLSAAIAAGLAQGKALNDAVAGAKRYVWRALQSGASLKIGHGAGPVDHMFAIRGQGSES